jgi:prepilin peptidase CpaA
VFVPVLVVMIATAVAGIIDVRRFRVPNVVTLPLVVSGIIYHAAVHGTAGAVSSGLGALFGIVVLVVPYLLGGMGSGDVKLLAGVGAWLGLPMTVYVFMIAALAGFAYALVVAARHGGIRRAASAAMILMMQLRNVSRHLVPTEQIESVVGQTERRRRLVPFAAMIAVGVIVVVICSQWLSNGSNPIQWSGP